MRRIFPFFILLVLLTACGPKLTPLLAEQEVQQNAALDQADVAKIGESLLMGMDMFAYAAYSPREAGVTLLAPDSVSLSELSPEQQWVAYYQLDDGSLIVEAPKSVALQDMKLGLRIDAEGRVVGNRPWFDLREKGRLNQPSWDGARRLLFVRNGSYPVDVFTFDLRYAGMKDAKGVFDYREYKERGMKPAEYKTLTLGEQESIQLHGLNIRIFEVYADHVRFVVEPVR